MSLWGDYWTVGVNCLSHRAWFIRRDYDANRLRYAGPVRKSWLRWWKPQTIEIEIAGVALPSFYFYVALEERAHFLEKLRSIAPQGKIVG